MHYIQDVRAVNVLLGEKTAKFICGDKKPHSHRTFISKIKKKSYFSKKYFLLRIEKVSSLPCIKEIVLDKENYRTQNGILGDSLYASFLFISKEIQNIWLIFF